MDPTKPHPQRFEVYNLLPGGKSFTIKDCNFIFKLDRHGGWKDENGHYYNSNGQPDFQPEDAQLTPQQGSIHSDDFQDDYGQFQPDYDNVDDQQDYQQHHSSWEIRNMEKISKNMETLSAYPLGKPLRVYFSNMPFKTPPKSVYQAYSKKVTGIINIIFDLQNNRRNGEGHFIVGDAKIAQTLVKLQGQKVCQRQVHFQVENISDLIMEPIKQKDLIPFWGVKQTSSKFSQKKQQRAQHKKQQVPKFKAAPAEYPKKQQEKKQQKKQSKQSNGKKVEQKKVQQRVEQKKQQKKQTQQPKKIQPQFKRYLLNFDIFDTKTKFFNWLQQNNGNKDTDIKNINKQQNNGVTKITMQVRTTLVEKLKGKKYNNKQVVFTLL